jgi:hypothetical protein
MALKVIGAGFGRTGTWSTLHALNQLGFPCYHMTEVVQNKANKPHLNFWLKVANSPPGAQQDWEQVFARCVWRELLVAYPDAKVLLTLHPRGAEAWYESTIDTIYFSEAMWQFKVLEWLTPFARKFGKMCHILIYERSLQGTMPDRAKAIARYNAHIDEVKAAVPADKLLVFSVDQGWAPLCAFLGAPTPADAFPNVNDRASFKKMVGNVINGMYVTVAAYAIVAALLLYGAYRLF